MLLGGSSLAAVTDCSVFSVALPACGKSLLGIRSVGPSRASWGCRWTCIAGVDKLGTYRRGSGVKLSRLIIFSETKSGKHRVGTVVVDGGGEYDSDVHICC